MEMWKNIVCGGESMRYGHLERVELSLKTLSPVFIGSGEELNKKEYIFDKTGLKIHMPDFARLTDYLSKHSLLPAFQTFMLNPGRNDLYAFLSDSGITKRDYPAFVSYTIDAGEAASEKFCSVLTFIKGADGYPYIPGSSLKGVIRTAIAAKLIEKSNYESRIEEIDKAADDFRNPLRYISKEADMLESNIFCKLGITDPRNLDRMKWDNIANDFMKGISISDSSPIGFDSLTLCGKYDRKPDGFTQQLPIFRECLAPGTTASFVMTMDRAILDKVGINREFIEDALHYFSDIHYESFEQHFSELPEDSEKKAEYGVDIILGGGAGYAAKSLVYSIIRDRGRALQLVSKMMTKQFRNHKHEKDIGTYKVSPHMLKTTKYKGEYYQMGRCELIFK